MTLKELKDWLNKLPEEFDGYSVVNGEVGYVTPEAKETMVYRVDKPIIALTVDEDTDEVCFFHQTQEDVNKMLNPN